jgi:hypothetical protein
MNSTTTRCHCSYLSFVTWKSARPQPRLTELCRIGIGLFSSMSGEQALIGCGNSIKPRTPSLFTY